MIKSSLGAMVSFLVDANLGEITSPMFEEESCLYRKDPLLCRKCFGKFSIGFDCDRKIGLDCTGVGPGLARRLFILSTFS